MKPDEILCQDAKHHFLPPNLAFPNIHYFKNKVVTQAFMEAQKTDYVFLCNNQGIFYHQQIWYCNI